jgi:hypothetical protein
VKAVLRVFQAGAYQRLTLCPAERSAHGVNRPDTLQGGQPVETVKEDMRPLLFPNCQLAKVAALGNQFFVP